jgi:hypothetical protein
MTTLPKFAPGQTARLTITDELAIPVRILEHELREPHDGFPMWFYRVDAVATWPDGGERRWVLEADLSTSQNHDLKADDATLGAPSVE